MPKANKTQSRRTCAPKTIATVEVPEHYKPSDGELAVFSRLVRVMRQLSSTDGAYWLGPYIEWLLYLDTTSPNLSFVLATDVLKVLGSDPISNTESLLRRLRKSSPGITFFSRILDEPRTGKINVFLPDSEEDQWYELLRQWRLEYPEPPKRREFPKGKTQHEMDPDSD